MRRLWSYYTVDLEMDCRRLAVSGVSLCGVALDGVLPWLPPWWVAEVPRARRTTTLSPIRDHREIVASGFYMVGAGGGRRE